MIIIISKINKAAKEGLLHEVKRLIEKESADVNERDMDGRTPLLGAARQGHLDVVKYLFGMGANIFAKDSSGEGPLLAAADKAAITEGHLDVVKYLLSVGANVNEKNPGGLTPLDTVLLSLKYTETPYENRHKGTTANITNLIKIGLELANHGGKLSYFTLDKVAQNKESILSNLKEEDRKLAECFIDKCEKGEQNKKEYQHNLPLVKSSYSDTLERSPEPLLDPWLVQAKQLKEIKENYFSYLNNQEKSGNKHRYDLYKNKISKPGKMKKSTGTINVTQKTNNNEKEDKNHSKENRDGNKKTSHVFSGSGGLFMGRNTPFSTQPNNNDRKRKSNPDSHDENNPKRLKL